MKLDEFFRCVGGDYGEAKARFQNGERIVRFLNMFPGDDSMQNLTNAMNASDTTTAFRAVHTLKGVALNLGQISHHIKTNIMSRRCIFRSRISKSNN